MRQAIVPQAASGFSRSKLARWGGAFAFAAIAFEVVFPLSGSALEPYDLRYLQGTGQCQDCNLSDAILTRAQLGGAQLMGVDLSNANLVQASLIAANLWSADLSGVQLMGANLAGADLSYANLSEANLAGAILYDVIFNGTNMVGALYNEDTVFDPEIDPVSLGMILIED